MKPWARGMQVIAAIAVAVVAVSSIVQAIRQGSFPGRAIKVAALSALLKRTICQSARMTQPEASRLSGGLVVMRMFSAA